MSCKYKRTITIDVENNEDGTYDAYISTGTCSGDQYSKISSDEIGENITDLIECLYEEQEKRYGKKNNCEWMIYFSIRRSDQ